jgi:hypothetical protein
LSDKVCGCPSPVLQINSYIFHEVSLFLLIPFSFPYPVAYHLINTWMSPGWQNPMQARVEGMCLLSAGGNQFISDVKSHALGFTWSWGHGAHLDLEQESNITLSDTIWAFVGLAPRQLRSLPVAPWSGSSQLRPVHSEFITRRIWSESLRGGNGVKKERQTSYGNTQDAPLLTNGSRKYGIYTQWNFMQPWRGTKCYHSLVNGWNWRTSFW